MKTFSEMHIQGIFTFSEPFLKKILRCVLQKEGVKKDKWAYRRLELLHRRVKRFFKMILEGDTRMELIRP